MKDVAERAGVSITAVSYALRGQPGIPEETAERIRTIATQIGYTKHPFVSALMQNIRAGRKMMAPPVIAYVSSYARRSYWITSAVQRGYFEGARARCEELGYAFALYELSRYGMSGPRLSRAMKYANVCGVLAGPVPNPGTSLDLDWDAFSCVAFGYSMNQPPIHRVTVNHWQSIGLALQRLAEMGYERIATGTTSNASRRIGGTFMAGVDAYNREAPRSRRIPILTGVPRTAAGMRRWLEKHRPDVFLEQAPYQYLKAITAAGLRIPEELACATMSWHASIPHLAGIHQNSFDIGKTAVDVLVSQVHDNRRGIPKLPTFTLVDGSWVDGPSVPWKTGAKELTAPPHAAGSN